MADDPKKPEDAEEEGGDGQDVEAEANVEFKPLIEVIREPVAFFEFCIANLNPQPKA
jgi:hypothetical protein